MLHRSSWVLFLVASCGGDAKDATSGETGVADADTDSDSDSDADADADSDADTDTDTGSTNGAGPSPVDLGSFVAADSAGSFVLLAETGITNVTGSEITGAVGLSPAAASFITGFSLVADPTNVFSTSPSVVAPFKVFAANYAVPTPSNLTVAVLAMHAAYTDAAGRTLPDYLNLSSGDLGGLTLAPGLYSWGSSVTVPSDVTIDGAANDVWIFQISGDLDVSAAKNVLLGGGADAANVFWQVAGQATIHENAHFEGVLLSQTGVTLQTNASLHGRVFAQTLIALDDNTVTAP